MIKFCIILVLLYTHSSQLIDSTLMQVDTLDTPARWDKTILSEHTLESHHKTHDSSQTLHIDTLYSGDKRLSTHEGS